MFHVMCAVIMCTHLIIFFKISHDNFLSVRRSEQEGSQTRTNLSFIWFVKRAEKFGYDECSMVAQ